AVGQLVGEHAQEEHERDRGGDREGGEPAGARDERGEHGGEDQTEDHRHDEPRGCEDDGDTPDVCDHPARCGPPAQPCHSCSLCPGPPTVRVDLPGRVGWRAYSAGMAVRSTEVPAPSVPTPSAPTPSGTPDEPEGLRPVALSPRSEEHTSELQSRENLVCRLLL